jgi:methanogenic corrinoid protein MtbC1
MPLIAQPQETWTRADYRSDGASPEVIAMRPQALAIGSDALAVVEIDVRPVSPAFMARRRHDVLAQTITQEIVPRLILARGAEPAAECSLPGALAEGHDISALVDILLHHNLSEAVHFVGGVVGRGAPVEAVYLDLLAPTARHLGTLWEDDICDFVQVTIGLNRLHQVLVGLSAPFQDDPRRQARRHRVLLVPAPGDSHSFGMSMVASFFQRAGWSGWTGVPDSPADLLRRVRAESFAIVGFSAGCGRRLDALSGAIRAVRKASVNPDVRIMVGGPVFAEHPELVAMVGADATATDGRQAVLQAQNLLALIPIRA